MPKLSGRIALVLSVIGGLLIVMVGWFFLVSPQRSKAADLSTQVASADVQLADAQRLLAAPNRKQTEATLRAARRALPNTPQTSEILRQLSAAVATSQTELESIGPGAVNATGGAESYPLTLSMTGRYFALQRFVRLLNSSADVKNGQITGKGRLYSIDGITFGGGGADPGQSDAVTATVNLNAFVYASAAAAAAAVPTDTTSSDTSTTAAGATP
jgi:hypothetical protein